jgi:hypothetical protein
MQHPTFSATLAEQHREELRRQANQARLTHGSVLNGRRIQWRVGHWWRPATRPAQP